MLARYPTLPPGEITSMVANIDVAATVADVAGIEIDAPDSVSLLDGTRNFVVLESAGGAKAHCGIRTSTRKYVRYATGEVEFYRLTKDPFELRNRPDAKAVDKLYRRAARVCSPLPADWPRETL